jgi:predicted Ser/Thr protein kinase
MEGTGAGREPGPSRFPAPDPEVLARELPQYELQGLVGQGGMGVVYKARQRSLDRTIALKILPAAAGRDPSFAERFTREAQALAALGHPGIVGVFDFGRAGEHLYLAMEYVEGLNLRQLLKSQEIGSRQALAIVSQVCDALQYAHDQGVVHRDIKPENILVDRHGRVKITDFGLAKLLGPGAGAFTLTGTDQVMGTPHYMAPEQVERPREVDHRADIYSLGVVFYELLTGELPLGRFTAPSKKVEVDVRLDEVVLRALEKEPSLRYQHASEVKTDVEHISEESAPKAERAGWADRLERSIENLGDMIESAVERSVGSVRVLDVDDEPKKDRRRGRDRAEAFATAVVGKGSRVKVMHWDLDADALSRKLWSIAIVVLAVGALTAWLVREIRERRNDDVGPDALVEYTDAGPKLGRWAIEEFALSPAQASAVDAAFSRLRSQYVAAELEHAALSFENGERLLVRIEPFPEERRALSVLLWSEVTAAMGERTPKSFYLDAIADYVFPYGEHETELELWRDAGGYKASTSKGRGLPYVYTWSRNGPQPVYRHLWAALRSTPRSADAALRLVLETFEHAAEQGARIDVLEVSASSVDGKDGARDVVKLALELELRAIDALTATRHYADWRADVERRGWCVEVPASGADTLDGGDGIRVARQDIVAIPDAVESAAGGEKADVQTLIRTLALREGVEPVDVGTSLRTRAGLFVDELYEIAPSKRGTAPTFDAVLAFSSALERECPDGVVTRLDIARADPRADGAERWRWQCVLSVRTTPR